MNCGSNWVDGIDFTFPADMGTINSWEVVGPGNLCSYGTDSGQNCNNLDGTLDGNTCLLYTSPSPRDVRSSRMPSSA